MSQHLTVMLDTQRSSLMVYTTATLERN